MNNGRHQRHYHGKLSVVNCVFAKKALFKRYCIICVSRQRVRHYIVFVTTQASLLVKKANEILNTARIQSV